MEIKITIDAPGMEGAIHTLSQVLAGMDLPQTQPTVEVEKSKGDKPAKQETKKETPKEDKKRETSEVDDGKPETGDEKPAVSLETVRVKLAELSQSGKQKDVKELIISMGAKKLSDIPKEAYAELLEKASEL